MTSDLLTLQDVADRLQVCYRTAFNWHKAKKLKTFKVGKVVRIRESDLEAFISGNVSEPSEVASKPSEVISEALKPVSKSRRRTKKAGISPGLAFLRKFDAGRK